MIKPLVNSYMPTENVRTSEDLEGIVGSKWYVYDVWNSLPSYTRYYKTQAPTN